MLGIHISLAVAWQRASGGDWTAYAAEVGRRTGQKREAFGQLEYPTSPEHADLAIKERALARTKPTTAKPGRYQSSDALLTFLDNLKPDQNPQP